MKSWLKKGCLVLTWIAAFGLLVALFVGGRFLVQGLTVNPEEMRLTQEAPPAGSTPGRVVLSLSSAAAIVKAGPAGGPIRVESSYDPEVHVMEQTFTEAGDGVDCNAVETRLPRYTRTLRQRTGQALPLDRCRGQ